MKRTGRNHKIRTGGKKRSPKWPTVRKRHLKNFPACAVCDGKKYLEVHHVVPFHLRPEYELDPNNLITLCENGKDGVNCHLFFGHLGSYQASNPSVREDAALWRKKINRRY